jgi:hypothetical protein
MVVPSPGAGGHQDATIVARALFQPRPVRRGPRSFLSCRNGRDAQKTWATIHRIGADSPQERGSRPAGPVDDGQHEGEFAALQPGWEGSAAPVLSTAPGHGMQKTAPKQPGRAARLEEAPAATHPAPHEKSEQLAEDEDHRCGSFRPRRNVARARGPAARWPPAPARAQRYRSRPAERRTPARVPCPDPPRGHGSAEPAAHTASAGQCPAAARRAATGGRMPGCAFESGHAPRPPLGCPHR